MKQQKWNILASRHRLVLASAVGLLGCTGEAFSEAQPEPGLDGGPVPMPGQDASVLARSDSGSAMDAGALPLPMDCDEVGLAPENGPPVSGDWRLTFIEDFLGPGINGDKWKIGEYWAGYNGIGAYHPDNMNVRCGYLDMRGEKRTASFGAKGPADYTGGEISSFKRFRQRYGYFEARARFDGVQGMWPAFWLMPDRGKYGDLGRNRTAFLKFDVGEVPENASRVVLRLTVAGADNHKAPHVMVLPAEDDWNEATLTGETQPTADARYLAEHYAPGWAPGEQVDIDVTDYVLRERKRDGLASFSLVDGFMKVSRLAFHSKEAARANHRPQLVVPGSDVSIPASDDGSVGAGPNRGASYGDEGTLEIFEDWGNTATTRNGGMEIDILEAQGQWGPHRNAHALHWDDYGADHKKEGSGRLDLEPTEDGFHTYGVLWEPGRLTFYIDGEQSWTWENRRVPDVAGFLIVSLQIGVWPDDLAEWPEGVTPWAPGAPRPRPDDASLPAHAEFDYVRVFERR